MSARAAAPSGEIALQPGSSTTDAFRAIAGRLVGLIAAQQAAVLNRDPTGVHQMRIALRRTRVTITIFSDLIHGPEAERLKRELKWLTGRLGPARDLHLMDLRLKDAGAVGSAAFRKKVAADRASAFDSASRAVATKHFVKLLGDLQSWIDAGDWAQTAKHVPEPAKKFAKRVLTRRADRLIKKLDALEQLDDEQRHRVRIAAKKLYYATGFFESLFDGPRTGKRLARFHKRLKKLLDALGALNDAAVQRELANRPAKRSQRTPAAGAAAAAELAAANEAITRQQMKAAVKAAAKLADSPLFGD
ncbi:CHAD domain-containing protein [Rhodopseudomonas palustris]|uniref:CHAD domain-containing protein n=1 Tax=Rhodopseudomonas palustris TaxID=1076 RepID=UPI001FD96114|nr:CHAD domain-containing protein [Rhodopseudomonas palustris]